jgi:cytochrome c oxidase cbb3-type subunit 3
MSEVKKMEHDFDGIEEFDNPLPGWWLAIFWVTIFIAIVYPIYYHVLYPDKLTWRKYDKDMAVIAEQKKEEAQKEKAPQDLMAIYKAGGWQDSAAADFKANCAVCHREDGGGLIGPNFHDDFYIHGGKFEDFIKTITDGVLEKGMTPFGGILKPEQIRNLAFHVRTFRGTPVEKPKDPQGQKVDADGNFIPAAEEPAEEAPAEATEAEPAQAPQ